MEKCVRYDTQVLFHRINYFFKKVKVQWTQQLVAVQEQKTEEIKKQTELMKALADANREKEVNFILN